MQAVIRRRWLFFGGVYVVLLVGGTLAGHLLQGLVNLDVRPGNEPTVHLVILTTAAIFFLASALPFVPGAEIGLALMLVFGGKIAFLVYVSMVAALVLAFIVGRFVPLETTAKAFRYLGLNRADDLLTGLAPLGPGERLALLSAEAPRRLIPVMLRHRYLALMILFNMPGNSILGGGGGIAFTAGLSGLFRYPGYLAAVSIAIAPVPLFFWLTS